MWALLAVAARRMDAGNFQFIDHDAFLLLGLVTGATLATLGHGASVVAFPAGVFVVALAWCSGISKGYQTPAHAAGPLTIMLILGVLGLFEEGMRARAERVGLACAVVVLAIVTPHWWSARNDHIIHEQTAPLLTHDLAGVLPGGRGIRTNANTHAMLVELRDVVNALGGRPYAIVVDAPAWWACAKQRNPLPADWPQSLELCTEELQARFSSSVLRQRGSIAVLVQKAYAVQLSEGFVPLGMDNFYYGAAIWVKHTLERESETRYWVVYR